MTASLPRPAAPAQDVTRSVLSIKPFRKLWNSMVFSSLGDWLGLLATTALAQQLSGGSYSTANFAIAGVFIARLLPAVFLGPLAGVLADRFDRRRLDGDRRHLACSAICIYPNCGHIFLALRRDDFG